MTSVPLPDAVWSRAAPSDPATPSTPHPDRPAEEAHLRATLATLERRIDEVGNKEIQGFNTWDTVALHRAYVAMYANLKAARKQVYFGRLDFTVDGAAPESHYLGKWGFDDGGRIVVVDWRAPVARLFSRRRPGASAYDSPDGRVGVTLHLKRQYQVRGTELVSLHDEYDTRPLPAGEARPRVVDPDSFLREILSGRGGAQMLDIVATIQEHQDDLIRADPRQVLVVQGVAGSGKTSIALHRVAYLLYPGNKTGIDGARCIIFGPNQLFLGYIGNVLPELGVAELAQTTLDAWAVERVGLAGWTLTDETQVLLLGAAVETAATKIPKPASAGYSSVRTGVNEAARRKAVARSRLKASLKMGQVLENFVNWQRARFAPPTDGLTFERVGPLKVTVAVARDRLVEMHRVLGGVPLARHRERVAELLLDDLMKGYAAAVKAYIDGMTEEGERLQRRRQTLHEEAARLAEYAALAEQEPDADLHEAATAAALARGAQALREFAAFMARQGERLVLRADRLRDEDRQGKDRKDVELALGEAARAALDRMWPRLEPAAGYLQLLGDVHLLARVGRGVMGADELELLYRGEAQAGDARSRPHVGPDTMRDSWASGEDGGNTLDVSDLPAVCYLHMLMEGVPAPLYDHIVVDEAQDVAPLYYAALRRLSRNGSLTLLGDLAQGVYGYRGLAVWDEAREVFAGLPYTYVEAAESYRSTFEIITFANRMLELLAPEGRAARLAKPFERHGAPVRLHELARKNELAPRLAEAVRALQGEGYANIAVIAKTRAQGRALSEALRAEGVEARLVGAAEDAALGEAEEVYAGGVVVIPVHLAKGMEFEAVLLAGAEAANYPATEFEGRLLYVAVTRALHRLEIFSVGEANAYLALANEG